MACGCGRSPDGCRGWHALTEEEYKLEYEKYLKEEKGDLTVTEVEHYTDTLFRFRLERPDNLEFIPGQFTMISLEDAPKRAYSLTNGPEDDFVEFFSIKVPNGPLTSKLQKIQVGDSVNVKLDASGTLITDNLTEGKELWLLATGTGIAPFISIIRDKATYEKFEKVNVIWSVRYRDELQAFDRLLKESKVNYIPIVTRDANWNGISERMTPLIEEYKLMDVSLPETDKVMVCGNMEFNKEIKSILTSRGWKEGSRREKGDFVLEKAFVG